ncbi:S-layer homology domain-containing protein [Herbivorax sp. ANBcel31]|uniref:S-layer homology domain-containing protein n=1 Tax=Herbivorax sp. ANBcel31 TaxID=3069754 RepID=UPI0027B2E23F|nr:S-layer homology domain-containing protein [Herbivorax sp. ANBcel31]MDQ2084969.1 S-layer homology domain-containing protein [Herbivorax sp. ANBcel31]
MLFICLLLFSTALYSQEVPQRVFEGTDNASTVLNNIDFDDVRNSGTWGTEAIYEVSALGMIKGYGNRIFGRTNNVTKEEAIAIIYRAVGREEEAQRMAEMLDNQRIEEDREESALRMWSDGYLRLAAEDGLIDWQDYEDAINLQEDEVLEEGFLRNGAATRQEVAQWMVMALQIEPVYEQQEIFNSFSDWTVADPHKVPYIEAALVNNIMSGMGNGYFRPLGSITREQMAQIVKNSSSVIYPVLEYEKKIGTVENISDSRNFTEGGDVVENIFSIRNSDGNLHHIVSKFSNERGNINEQSGVPLGGQDIDLIVYRDGVIGNSSLLVEGDRIEYIISPEERVKFISVISNTSDTNYVVGKINSVDNGEVNISKIFDLNYPTVDIESRNFSFDTDGRDVDITYVLSSNAEVFVDGRIGEAENIQKGEDAILSVRDNIVTGIKTIELRFREQGILNGIVEENNPHLGYITLYNDSDYHLEKSPLERIDFLKTYNYSNPKDIQVLRNGREADIEDIQAGDTAYIKLDDDNIEIISAVDNYRAKYGKIISKRSDNIVVMYDDGMQQVLEIDDPLIVLNKRVTDYDTLKEGDRVKLILNITDKFTDVKQITIDGTGHHIANIYKGIVDGLDYVTGRLIVRNLEVFQNGRWLRTEQKGFYSMELDENNNFIYNDKNLNEYDVEKLFKDREAYIAVKEDFGRNEKAVAVSFRNSNDSEAGIFDDSITNTTSDGFMLESEYRNVKYNNGTIIIKDNRLVSANSISEEDMAYVVANRRYEDGEYYAGVIAINDRFDPDFIDIYRGRIADIDTNNSVAVESFSRLDGLDWEFFNTPKTFLLTYDTKIVDDEGIIGQRNFLDFGESSFKDRTVYILADETDAVLITTAPYGNKNIRGEIYDIMAENAVNEEGEELEPQDPHGFMLIDVKEYDSSSFMWEDEENTTLNILDTSIILKDNSIAQPSDLKKGDRVRVIKSEGNDSEDAYIILVE